VTIVVSGANGFIGRALCRHLSGQGRVVRAVVHRPGRTSAGQQEVILAIGPQTNWQAVLEGVEIVVHLAAHVHVRSHASKDEDAFHEINTLGTRTLAEAAIRAGVKRLVYLSTVKVHGEASAHPFRESDVLAPQDAYARSKAAAEEELKRVAKSGLMDFVILRPPMVYGPGVKANFLTLLHAVSNRVPLPFAGIANRRSLIYLGNLVDAIAQCIVHPKAANQSFFVSDGYDVSTPDLVRAIAEAMGVRPRLFGVPKWGLEALGKVIGKSKDMERLTSSLEVDTSTIRQRLGWQPPYSFAEGIQETVDWFLKERAGAVRIA